ncbi:MAG TPA: pilus assembly protein TadG-related protein [Candidatus Limnocylindria bacterium]
MPTTETTIHTSSAARRRASEGTGRSRGQVLVLFALLLTFLLGTAAFVVDLAWIWVNELKVQRAADAGALAGVVHLPGAVALANSSALDETDRNGYQDSTNNAGNQAAQAVDVWARPDAADPRRMLVRVSTNIETFFMQIFGVDTLRITRDAKAEFVLPVPMGSPENYYGVFGAIRTPDGGVWQPNATVALAALTPRNVVSSSSSATGTNQNNNADSCSTAAGVSWSNFPTTGTAPQQDDRVNSSNNQWIRSSRLNDRVCLSDFGIAFPANPPSPGGSAPAYPGHVVDGIEVRIEAFDSDNNPTTASCQIRADLMWGAAGSGGTQNTSGSGDKTMVVNSIEPAASPWQVLGGSTDQWNRTWALSDLTANTFRVRLWNLDPATCDQLSAGWPANGMRPSGGTAPSSPVAGEVYVDTVQVIVHYHTYTWIPDPQVRSPYNQALNARGLWGTFINQGAEKVNGDAYLPKWDPRTSGANAEYNPNQYYNYAIEMPAGATAGEVWVFDPAFCATDGNGQYGTGDRWFSGSTAATSAYYTLYNTFNTPFDLGDDLAGVVSQAHNIFTNQQASDKSLNGPGGVTDCDQGATAALNDGRFWHNRWYPMQPYTAPGSLAQETPASAEQPWPLLAGGPTSAPTLPMTGGNTYRLHTRSTNPANATAMDNANGHNSFSIWTRAWCGGSVCASAPRVYGLGAMEAFTPLPGGGAAQFYLAEIEPVHAGKSIEIRLWDPGDTGNLSADLRIKYPSGGAYQNADMDFVANAVASGAANCNGRTDDTVGPAGPLDPVITTNTGGSSQYNGCWLTIVIVIPDTYDGDACPGVPPCLDQNWWKIEYTMGGSASENAFDLTTWQVTLRGNPVHLVVP